MAIRDLIKRQTPIHSSEGPYLVVGLGNIGPEYAFTRHNAGFLALDAYKGDEMGDFKVKPDLNAMVIETASEDSKLILAKPTTLMNRSGLAVSKLQQYYKVNDERILIVHDDVDLEFGIVRSRVGGSSGGHNGLKSVESVIGPDFARVKIGVKNDTLTNQDTADYVLKNFSKAEEAQLPDILTHSSEQIDNFLTNTFKPHSKTV